MKEWEMVATAVAGGIVGVEAEKSITIPVSTNNNMLDNAINIGTGLAAAYLFAKYTDDGLAVAGTAAGLGWAGSAGLSTVGIRL